MIGGRHRIYGVKANDYQVFCDTVCETMRDILGPHVFSQKTKDAWFRIFTSLSAIMQDAGRKIENEVFVPNLNLLTL